MLSTFASLFSLLLGTAILLSGIGLLSTLLGVRGTLEGFSQSGMGVVMSAYFAGFVVGTRAVPRIIRRVGHIRAFAAMAAVAAATAISHALFITPAAWVALRAVMGLCVVGLYMVIESWINSAAPNNRRGQVLATYMTITLLAMAGGQYLMLVAPPAGFKLFAVTTILLVLALVPIALTRIHQPQVVEPHGLGLQRLFRISPLGVAGAFVTGAANSSFFGMAAVFAAGMGFDAPRIAAFMSATILGGAVLQWPLGRLSDRHDRRAVLTVNCAAAALLGGGAYGLAGYSPLGLLVCMFLYGGVAFAAYSLSVAHVNDQLPPELALEASSGLLLIYGIGSVLGPAVVGALMDLFGVGALLLYFVATYGALALFAGYRMVVGEKVGPEDQGTFIPVVRTSPVALELDPRVPVEDDEEVPENEVSLP